MTAPTRAIEAMAKAIRAERGLYGKPSIASIQQAQAAHTAYREYLAAEGFVVVPRETFFEIANRAGNMSDPDAADWLPSIYRIACEAVGEDPWPMLRAAGYSQETLTVSIAAAQQEQNDAKR